MSDFIYSKNLFSSGLLTNEIQAIYNLDPPSVKEFHGNWGSLAVSHNIYNGFQPYETTEHICIVLGGPVLCFQDNKFITGNNATAGTQAIYNHWLAGLIQWDEDLSGPFVFLVINKATSEVTCITDLMSFIPVFIYQESDTVLLSTHIDVLARVSGQQNNIDVVSQVDFVLNGLITFPYTAYAALRQISPASIYTLANKALQFQQSPYWIPDEKIQFNSIDEAASELRNGLQNYVNAITESMPVIAQFISGGEDSRTLSALLPKQSQRDAFIFLDSMNREGKLAKKTAIAYGAHFNIATRSATHYLDILPACADLVGSGAQFHHVHTFGFHKSCKLNEYSAVFGGFMSDTLLKGLKIKKIPFTLRFPFFPQIKQNQFTSANPLVNATFTNEVLSEVCKRRRAHLEYVKSFRNESAEEWFYLWPISMQTEIPNVHGNRRLFRSYEPFMCKEVVKVSAQSQQKWKLNRRLFHKAAKPLLQRTKWLLHGDGRLPYFPWYINSFVQFFSWFLEQVGRRTGLVKGNQGPWGEWGITMKSPAWQQAISDYSEGIKPIEIAFADKNVLNIFRQHKLNHDQTINFMQVLYALHKN